MRERVYSHKVRVGLPDNPPSPTAISLRVSRRRRVPSPAEQERRVKWGQEWGARVSEATAHLRKG